MSDFYEIQAKYYEDHANLLLKLAESFRAAGKNGSAVVPLPVVIPTPAVSAATTEKVVPAKKNNAAKATPASPAPTVPATKDKKDKADKKKRPLSAYQLFMSDRMKNRADHEMSPKSAMAILSKEWQSLEQTSKQVYITQSEKLKADGAAILASTTSSVAPVVQTTSETPKPPSKKRKEHPTESDQAAKPVPVPVPAPTKTPAKTPKTESEKPKPTPIAPPVSVPPTPAVVEATPGGEETKKKKKKKKKHHSDEEN